MPHPRRGIPGVLKGYMGYGPPTLHRGVPEGLACSLWRKCHSGANFVTFQCHVYRGVEALDSLNFLSLHMLYDIAQNKRMLARRLLKD